jgi:hypothetical protein
MTGLFISEKYGYVSTTIYVMSHIITEQGQRVHTIVERFQRFIRHPWLMSGRYTFRTEIWCGSLNIICCEFGDFMMFDKWIQMLILTFLNGKTMLPPPICTYLFLAHMLHNWKVWETLSSKVTLIKDQDVCIYLLRVREELWLGNSHWKRPC